MPNQLSRCRLHGPRGFQLRKTGPAANNQSPTAQIIDTALDLTVIFLYSTIMPIWPFPLLFQQGDYLGAQAYAGHYGLRLPKAREWYALMASQPSGDAVRLPLPTPVINYSKNRFGIRGIAEIAEWGKNREGSFVVLGQASSTMIESELVSVKDSDKYSTDTSFRVARDADMDKVPKQNR